MVQTATKKSKNQMLSIHPAAGFEIEFGGLLKPMSDDEFFNFCHQRNTVGWGEERTQRNNKHSKLGITSSP